MRRHTILFVSGMMFALLVASFLTLPVLAVSETIQMNTGDLEYSGVTIRAVYSAQADLSLPSFMLPQSSAECSTYLGQGRIHISVYVPSPVAREFNTSMSVPVGSYVDVPIYAGISARVKLTGSSTISTNYAARVNVNSLPWNSEGTQRITITSTDALLRPHLYMQFSFEIRLGLIIDLTLFSFQLVETTLGTFPATPELSRIVPISGATATFGIIGAVLVFSGAICGYLFYRTRKHTRKTRIGEVSNLKFTSNSMSLCSTCGAQVAKTESFCPNCGTKIRIGEKRVNAQVMTGPEPSPQPSARIASVKFCIYCGQRLPLEAVFCSKCGKSLPNMEEDE